MSSHAQAGSKAPPDPNAKRDAAKAAADKKKDEQNRAILDHLAYLQTYLPRVTSADIRDHNITDLRHLYYEAYRVQGISMEEATLKAATEITLEKAGKTSMRNGIKSIAPKNSGNFVSHLPYLSQYLPDLKPSDLTGRNAEDVRRMYSEAYRIQGATLVEANKKAALLVLESPGNKKTLTSLPDLKVPLPDLNPADLKGKSPEDMRRIYYDAFRKQGMSAAEAKAKADQIDLGNRAVQ